jgi:hypothetical protein
MTRASSASAALLGLGILALLIGTNAWTFSTLGHTSYFVWYLKNGSAVALGASFLGLIWDGLALHDDLLAAHPLKYLRGCFGLISVLFHAASDTSRARSREPGLMSALGRRWECSSMALSRSSYSG